MAVQNGLSITDIVQRDGVTTTGGVRTRPPVLGDRTVLSFVPSSWGTHFSEMKMPRIERSGASKCLDDSIDRLARRISKSPDGVS